MDTLARLPRFRLAAPLIALVGLMCAVAPIAGASPAATVTTRVPKGFVGVDVDGPMLAPSDNVDLSQQAAEMVASGVQSIRVVFSWAQAQPYAAWADVPSAQQSQFESGADNVPTDFAATDEIVALAATHGMRVLPTVIYAPPWDAGRNPAGGLSPPAGAAGYASYLTTLIGRYGPDGSFWVTHPSIPKQPIRTWQVWNEPNLTVYWPQPFARSYVALLSAAHAAIKQADPGATVVLGALTNYVWRYLRQIYQVPGARGDFDEVAVNGFTANPTNVIVLLSDVRHALDRDGDGAKPMLATELSFPSAVGRSPQHFDWDTTKAGQAADIAQLLPLLAAHRRTLDLAGFDYYTWMGQEYTGAPAFNFAGLLSYGAGGRVAAKPALAAFARAALALEGRR